MHESPLILNDSPLVGTTTRPRLLMVAYGCHPADTMEKRNGWRRAMLAAESCDVTVLVGPAVDTAELTHLAAKELGQAGRVAFHRVQHDALDRFFASTPMLYYLYYRRWNNRAYALAESLHRESPFDLVHQVNFCGYREPGLMWRLGVPFIWGPIGGTQDFPLRYLGQLSWGAALREVSRSVLNGLQIRMSQRVRRAARGSAVVLSATATAKQHLREFIGVDSIQHLETGLDCQVSSPRTARDATEPLRVLWAGRLRPWKCFPLLAKAVAELPDARRVQVRVLGTGPCKSPWIRLTERLGIADRFEWIEWPAYQDTLQHYAWADVFAFTSLRDTSGTGLLESLAAGAPVLGVDHQGAADIMTEHCAIPLPVSSPEETIRHLAQAMVELDDDRNRLLQLSHGAQQRAADFEWHRRIAWTSEVYRSALQQSAREAKALPSLATLKQQTDLDSPVPVGVSTGSAASATY